MTLQRIKVAHTSDVHLDGNSSSGAFGRFRNHAEYAFSQVIDRVISENCDLLLIVGDLFDHNRINESDVEFVRHELRRISQPVILIPGNHDVYDEYSLWHKFDPYDLGTNVFPILDHEGTQIHFDEIGVHVWGRAMEEHAPSNFPLANVPEPDSSVWNIGLAHGQVVDTHVDGTSSLITGSEIASSRFDYVALGHVHVWETFRFGEVIACYPGSPVQAYASSRGGHMAIVHFEPDRSVDVVQHRLIPHSNMKTPVDIPFIV